MPAQFRPPSGRTTSQHFDVVTGGVAKNIPKTHTYSVWQAVNAKLQPIRSPAEKIALYAEFMERLSASGYKHGYLASNQVSPKAQANVIADYIVHDRLGIPKGQGKSAEQKAADEMKGFARQWVVSHLSKTSSRRLEFMEQMTKLAEAKTPDDVIKVLVGLGDQSISNWAADNKGLIIRNTVGRTTYGRAFSIAIIRRTRVLRRLARSASKFARRLNPWLLSLELLLTPSSTASDFEMWRSNFLLALDEAGETLARLAAPELDRVMGPEMFAPRIDPNAVLKPKGPTLSALP